MMPDLKSIPELPLDEAFSLVADYKADAYRNKVSLSAGVYRDEAGNPWTLSSVREVCRNGEKHFHLMLTP